MKPYSLNAHDLNFAGFDIDDQRGKVTITPVGERYTFKPGTDGTTTMSENAGNDNAVVEIELDYGSAGNGLLSAWYNLNKLSDAGKSAVAALVLKDRVGNSLFLTQSAVIVGQPTRERAAESGTIVWKIYAEQPTWFEGGLPNE